MVRFSRRHSSIHEGDYHMTKIGFAAAALAAAMLMLPAGAAQAAPAKTWECEMFGWLNPSLCKQKVAKKKAKKKVVSKKKKAMKKKA
jgi:hypothetical protein